ncbi:MAG TPA: sialate O-acetylesterase [Chitinophagaceae bacterium]|nr:sialate O-acetylesterase [Chitinophagaceae bacterium]
MKKIITICSFIFISAPVFADVRLPKIFGDNMVLQRNKPIPVWGWASPKEKITIQFDHQAKTVKADKNGKWMVKLDNEAAGGPYQLIIKGKNTLTFNNVMVGEVWVCSGQSNMEFPVEGWGKVMNYQQEIQNASYPMIRQIKVPLTVASTPKDDIPSGDWKICSPATVGDFTAVGYFFGRELYNELKIPIGLINTTWGGTQVESWTSREAFENSNEFKSMIASMPSLDLDSLAKVRKEETLKRVEALQGPLPAAEETKEWSSLSFDDSHWPHIHAPGLWEYQQPGDLDGFVWYRKTIYLSADKAGKPATLELAMIDDNDITYVNGVKAGSTDGYNVKRNYTLAAGVLKEGKNVIAVRVEDTGGGGGIYGDSSDMKLTIGDNVIPLYGDWSYAVESITGGSGSVGPNSYPTLLFNAMVNPIIPYAMEGVIWYQGEANADRAYQYRKAFPLMINDWRSRWGEGNFPFYFVQLSSWNADNGNSNKGSTWAELREAQAMTLSLPNTGMAVTTDIGNETDIHPKDKQDVGKRLAALAFHNVYGKDVVCSGPVYQSMQVSGNKVTLSFTGIGSGWMVKDKYGYIKGFEVAGADQHFYYAKAYIDGDKVVVYSDNVNAPVAVRYNWADYANDGNLFNMEGFPAGPFRTDTWKGITEEAKFTIGP